MSKAKKLIKYFVVFMVPVICMLIHMYIRGCYPFGKNTILLGDANAQYYWFEKMLLEKIKNGESILFSWQAGMGFEFYQNFFYYLGSPFNIIAMIIGSWNMEIGVAATMIAQIGMCSATMLYYLGHTSRNIIRNDRMNVPLCMTFAIAYSMCDYFLAYQYNYIWLISLMLAPLVMLGVEKLIDGSGAGFYIGVLTLVFITNFYFAWFICILSFVWYVDYCKGSYKWVARLTLKYIESSVVSAMLAAFVLVPCYLAVKGRTNITLQEEGLKWNKFGNIADFIQSFFWGSPINQAGRGLFVNNNYVGVSVILISIMFIFNSKIKLKDRVKRLLEIFLLSICLNWEIGLYLFHGFTLPNSYSNRYSFILTIILLVTVFEELVNLNRANIQQVLLELLIFAIIVLYAILNNTDVLDALAYMITCLVAMYITVCMVLYARKSITLKSFRINIMVLVLIELFSNYYYVGATSCDKSEEKNRDTKNWIQQYDNLDVTVGERKTSWVDSQMGMGNSDTDIFSSIINRNMLNMYKGLGLSYQNNGCAYMYRGTTPLMTMLYNVKYVFTDHPMYYGGYEQISEQQFYNDYTDKEVKAGVYKSKYNTALGYMVSDSIKNWQINNDDPFATQNEFTNEVLNVGNLFSKVRTTDLSVHSFGCKVEKLDDTDVTYKNIWEMDGFFQAANTYKFTALDNMHLYIYVRDDKNVTCSVYVDDEPVVDDSRYICTADMIDVGYVKKGQSIKLRISNNSSSGQISTTYVRLYKIDDQLMSDVEACLTDSIYKVIALKGSKVKGTVNVTEDGVLYTSIPYYKCTKVFVDGKEKDILLIGDALCGVELTEGQHIVEFRYFPYGLKTGIIISCSALLLSICSMIVRHRKKSVRNV